MMNINATNFRKDLFHLMSQTILYNEPINISTKDGNAVLLSEDDYNGLMETVRICSNPILRAKILDGMNTPLEDCLDESKVQW